MCRQRYLLTLCVAIYSMFMYSGLKAAGSLTGVYRDNGVQTIKESLLSANDRNKIEKEILTMFGVPVKHKKSPRSMYGSATQFLFDIYKSIELDSSNNRRTREVSSIGQYDDRIVLDSDVIVTLYLSKHLNNIRHEHGKRIVFELKDIPSDNNHMITSAIVHLYQSAISNTSSINMYSVTLYQIMLSESGEKELEFVDSQNTTIDYDGWLYFNATSTLISWTLSTFPNRGLYVSVRLLDDKDNEINPEEIGMVTWTDKHELLDMKKPFMAVYLKSKIGGNRVVTPPLKKHNRQRRKEYIGNSSNNSNPLQYIEDKLHYRSCQKEILYVSFKDLEWQDWIIAPDGYGAYYCTGECNFPLGGNMNATNHAILQTLMHLMNPLKVPKPCCAPTKMTHQSVLFFLEDNNVILKKYKNMIVKSCGCH